MASPVKTADGEAVHEISGIVPSETIDGLLRTMGVEPGEGVNLSLAKEGFEGVRKAVKRVGREGWSAGQVLEQVNTVILLPVLWLRVMVMSVARRADPVTYHRCDPEVTSCACNRRMRQRVV